MTPDTVDSLTASADPRAAEVAERVVTLIRERMPEARVEQGEHKDDPLDFALWKGAKPGEPAWTSPWNGPCTMQASIQTLTPRRMWSLPSESRARTPSKSSIGTPKSRSHNNLYVAMAELRGETVPLIMGAPPRPGEPLPEGALRFRDPRIHLIVRKAEVTLGQRLPLADAGLLDVSQQFDVHIHFVRGKAPHCALAAASGTGSPQMTRPP